MKKIYYVYAYMRLDGSFYYIGKGKGRRAWDKKHKVYVPSNERIVILEENLTNDEACEIETKFISLYGRKDIGTGILRNKTNGGDGSSGRIEPEDKKIKRAAKIRETTNTERGKKIKILTSRRLWKTPEYVKSFTEGMKRRYDNLSVEERKKLSERTFSQWRDEEIRQRRIDSMNAYHKSELGKKTKSESTLKRVKNGNHPSQIKKTCEHCGYTCGSGQYKQWHGDKCKHKG